MRVTSLRAACEISEAGFCHFLVNVSYFVCVLLRLNDNIRKIIIFVKNGTFVNSNHLNCNFWKILNSDLNNQLEFIQKDNDMGHSTRGFIVIIQHQVISDQWCISKLLITRSICTSPCVDSVWQCVIVLCKFILYIQYLPTHRHLYTQTLIHQGAPFFLTL